MLQLSVLKPEKASPFQALELKMLFVKLLLRFVQPLLNQVKDAALLRSGILSIRSRDRCLGLAKSSSFVSLINLGLLF